MTFKEKINKINNILTEVEQYTNVDSNYIIIGINGTVFFILTK